MDELKLLIDMVANLPTLAVWVLVGYLVYKVAIVGSIYGVIRLLIVKIHDVLTRPQVTKTEYNIGNCAIDEAVANVLRAEIMRLSSTGRYIHPDDVAKLRKAVDAVLVERAK